MKLALIFVVLACLFVAATIAEPELFESDHNHYPTDKKCCENRPGRDGRDGRDGIDGRNGRNGANGVDGSNGSNGTDGVDAVAAEYGEMYGTAAATLAAGMTIPFSSPNGLSAGVTWAAPGALTVAKSGQYLVTVYLVPSSTTVSTVTLRVNGNVISGNQYSFTAGSSVGAMNMMTANLHLTAGQTITLVTAAALALTGTVTTPNANLNLISLSLD